MSELHLELAFARAGAARKDVQNELRAIDDLPADLLLDMPKLGWRKLAVEHHDVHAGLRSRIAECGELAAAEIRRRVRFRPLLHHAQNHFGAGGLRQPRQLVERAFSVETPSGSLA